MPMKALLTVCAFFAVLSTGCKDKQLEAEHKELQAEHKELDSTRNDLLSQLDRIKAEEQERKNRLSPLQRQQFAKLLDSGSRVNAAVKSGVSLQNFRTLHAEYNGAVSLASSNWPQAISIGTKKKLEEAAECWSFSQEIWGDKIVYEKDIPGGFFVSDQPIPGPLKGLIKTHQYNSINGKKLEQAPWTSFQIGLTVGSRRFEDAQSELLKELNE